MTLRMTRRGFLAVTGGAAAAAGLAACGDDSGGSGGGTATLRLVGASDQQKAIDVFIKAYTKAQFTTSYAPVDQLQTTLRTQLGAGSAPDLHVLYPGNGSALSMVQISNAGLLADLSDQAWTKNIPDNLKPVYQSQGKTYIYSAGVSVIGAIYNKKLFQQAKVEPPTTWSEFLKVCDAIKKTGKVPIALGTQTPAVTQMISYALVPSTVYAKTSDFDERMSNGSTSFADSGWVEAFTKYLELRDRGFFNENPNGTTWEQMTAMVAKGEAAMAIQVANAMPEFRKAMPSEDVSMFPVPGSDDATKVWVPAGVIVGLGVSARSQNVDAAKGFIEFLGQQENINAWAETMACVPLVRDANSKIDPVLEPFLPFIEQKKAVPFMDQKWPNAEVQPTHFAVLQELIAGRTTVADALKKMDETYRGN